jgi:hypothetical protein
MTPLSHGSQTKKKYGKTEKIKNNPLFFPAPR